MLQSLRCTPNQFFTGGFSVSLRNFHDQLVNGNRFLLCNLMKQLQERGVAAGKAEDQILRQYGGAVAIGLHGGNQFIVQIGQQSIEVHTAEEPLPQEGGGSHFRGAVSGAACHAQQAAVDLLGADRHGCQCISL